MLTVVAPPGGYASAVRFTRPSSAAVVSQNSWCTGVAVCVGVGAIPGVSVGVLADVAAGVGVGEAIDVAVGVGAGGRM